MPRISRRVLRHSLRYTSKHVFQMCHGHVFFGDAFGNGEEKIEAMREAWPELREQVFQQNEQRRARYVEPTGKQKESGELYGYDYCALMPWGWWCFESEQERDTSISEGEQLRRMGVKVPTQYAGSESLPPPCVAHRPQTLGLPGYPRVGLDEVLGRPGRPDPIERMEPAEDGDE